MSNQLTKCTSLYLRQHADNPVNWYPWGNEALELARQTGKPILLSIGYAACHWCHVMAHESFADTTIAALMNAHFVNIKVDREQRPDLDKIYQTAHQLITQRAGGWPLTVFLTHDTLVPFFAGTYFPPTARHGLPAFQTVLEQVHDAYVNDRGAILSHNQSMRDVLARVFKVPNVDLDVVLGELPLGQAIHQLAEEFDSVYGGFGGAPKFPHASSLQFMLHYYEKYQDTITLDKMLLTLEKMARGGIYDHIGGGFFRYATDERWEIPHFEKMLYDNASLIELYAAAWSMDGNALFAKIATDTARWVMREMQATEGGYYSALDADVADKEGDYYVWQRDRVAQEVPSEDFPLVAAYFGLDQAPNFEEQWHLHATCSPEWLAKRFKREEFDILLSLDRAITSLFWARQKRERPARDDKILTAWNGLMIRGMATAGRLLGRDDFIHSAARALDFIRTTLWHNQRLQACHAQGTSEFNGYLDDYAFTADGALSLLQARWDETYLQFSQALCDAMLQHFTMPHGGFYFTAHDHEMVVQRPCQFSDDALPAGNAIAIDVLLRLGYLLGETRYLDAAERALRAAWDTVMRAPLAHCSTLSALGNYLTKTEIIVLRGEAEDLLEWQIACQREWRSHRMVLSIPSDAQQLPAALAAKTPLANARVTAYWCRGMECGAPITDLAQWQALLKSG
jgi:uncharacterized protein